MKICHPFVETLRCSRPLLVEAHKWEERNGFSTAVGSERSALSGFNLRSGSLGCW